MQNTERKYVGWEVIHTAVVATALDCLSTGNIEVEDEAGMVVELGWLLHKAAVQVALGEDEGNVTIGEPVRKLLCDAAAAMVAWERVDDSHDELVEVCEMCGTTLFDEVVNFIQYTHPNHPEWLHNRAAAEKWLEEEVVGWLS